MKGKHLWAVLLAAAILCGLLGSGGLALEESSPAELETAQAVPVREESAATEETASPQPTQEGTVPAETDVQLEKDVALLEEPTDLEQMPLLVNLWNPLPEDYTVELEKLDNGLQIAAEARPDLEQMLSDCEAAGLDVTVCSAYRTESTQNRLYQNKIARLRAARIQPGRRRWRRQDAGWRPRAPASTRRGWRWTLWPQITRCWMKSRPRQRSSSGSWSIAGNTALSSAILRTSPRSRASAMSRGTIAMWVGRLPQPSMRGASVWRNT